MKLNQVIAISNGKKSQASKTVTEIYKTIQKPELFDGLAKTYIPKDEEGDTLPSESKLPQQQLATQISKAVEAWSDLINVVATQDNANCSARADIVVDEKVIQKDVPVTHLLFLEKHLQDVCTFIETLPVLSATEDWKKDENRPGLYRTDPIVTNRNQKVMKNHVRAAATEKHPAQVDVYTEDVKVGEWSTTKFSGALPPKEKEEKLNKAKKLLEAVKLARESANSTEVTKTEYAKSLLGYVFN